MPCRASAWTSNRSGVGFGGNTMKGTGALVAAPTLTVSGPRVAEAGTVATSETELADVTGATAPLNETVLALGMALNPSPLMVTGAPAGAEGGLRDSIARDGGSCAVKAERNSAGSAWPCRSRSGECTTSGPAAPEASGTHGLKNTLRPSSWEPPADAA